MKKPRRFVPSKALRVSLLFATTFVTSAIALGTTATPAQAACSLIDGQEVLYAFSNVKTSQRPTNVYSDWIQTGSRGGSISYSQTRTATVSASMTATISAEAGIVFARASASIGVTVGASYSWSNTFSYTMNVGPNVTARMRLYTESRSFTVTKKRINHSTCKYNVVYSNNSANAPRATHNNVWKLEYR